MCIVVWHTVDYFSAALHNKWKINQIDMNLLKLIWLIKKSILSSLLLYFRNKFIKLKKQYNMKSL